MPDSTRNDSNGLRRALDTRIVSSLSELSELRGELRASLQAINEKIDHLLDLHEKVDQNSMAIARLKTLAALLAAGVAFVVSALKEWLFGVR